MVSILDKYQSIQVEKPEPKKDESKLDIITKDMIHPIGDINDDSNILEFEPEVDVSQQVDMLKMVFQPQTTEELLGYCDTVLDGFGVINSNLIKIDDELTKRQLDYSMIDDDEQLDLFDNCLWFINKAYAVLMPYGYHINGSNPILKTKSIINALVSIKNDLMKGNVKNQYDLEFILLVLYMDFHNYGSFVGIG